MITEQDLQEAIAECLGQRDPNANTCIKLAAYYTIQKELYGEQSQTTFPIYSRASPVEQDEVYVNYDGNTDFSRAVNGMDAKRAWGIIDELVDAVRVVNPRLYKGLMKKVEEG